MELRPRYNCVNYPAVKNISTSFLLLIIGRQQNIRTVMTVGLC